MVTNFIRSETVLSLLYFSLVINIKAQHKMRSKGIINKGLLTSDVSLFTLQHLQR